ncbi:hypothetical protein KQI82_12830 [Oscillibacter sp. MSJ-2]|uniref:Peptidoglycan binding-like domain-containing protein n=1 Tax=Dysosmobacter acutus TaxID=2841504 RepID=A0ABS6FBY6_9FIRM|nr:hypothetical protein [Dysosmobacter acutus]MBU5627795.1 hypothetical protein [Dysosmobacter acutus]
MAGVSCPHSGECESILNLSGYLVWSNPFGTERAVRAAVWRVRNHPEFSAGECIDLIKRAAEWGSGYAAGGSGKNRAFLEEISQGKGKDFFEEVIKAYENGWEPEVRGGCGHVIGGNKYLSHMEGEVFLRELPADNSARWGGADYAGALKESVEGIARQMERDLERGERENSYITDETERALKLAAVELGRCGAGIGSLGGKIERLAWFVGGDPSKIRQLQSKLNQIGVGEHLTEDGVYGKKTLEAWERFLRNLEHGAVPTLAWIDPLKNHFITLEIENSFSGVNNTIRNAETHFHYFRVDPPHIKSNGSIKDVFYRGVKRPMNYNHVNVDFGKNATNFHIWLQKQYNHYPLSDTAYDMLKDLKATGKKVRIAGKVLLVGGIALDALELGTAIDADLKDADRKIGKKTLSVAASAGRLYGK